MQQDKDLGDFSGNPHWVKLINILSSTRVVDFSKYGPERTKQIIGQKIQSAIDKAPVFENDQIPADLELIGSENTLSFKVPEDSHIYPLLENELFRSLLQLSQQQIDKNTTVNETYLMLVDPELPTIVSRTFKGVKIRGETLLEHEFSHALAAREAGMRDAYFSLSFYWVKKGKTKELNLQAYGGVMPSEVATDLKKQVLLAPRYPSRGDLSKVADIESGDSWIKSLFQGICNELKESMGSTITAEGVQDSLLEVWKKERYLPHARLER